MSELPERQVYNRLPNKTNLYPESIIAGSAVGYLTISGMLDFYDQALPLFAPSMAPGLVLAYGAAKTIEHFGLNSSWRAARQNKQQIYENLRRVNPYPSTGLFEPLRDKKTYLIWHGLPDKSSVSHSYVPEIRRQINEHKPDYFCLPRVDAEAGVLPLDHLDYSPKYMDIFLKGHKLQFKAKSSNPETTNPYVGVKADELLSKLPEEPSGPVSVHQLINNHPNPSHPAIRRYGCYDEQSLDQSRVFDMMRDLAAERFTELQTAGSLGQKDYKWQKPTVIGDKLTYFDPVSFRTSSILQKTEFPSWNALYNEYQRYVQARIIDPKCDELFEYSVIGLISGKFGVEQCLSTDKNKTDLDNLIKYNSLSLAILGDKNRHSLRQPKIANKLFNFTSAAVMTFGGLGIINAPLAIEDSEKLNTKINDNTQTIFENANRPFDLPTNWDSTITWIHDGFGLSIGRTESINSTVSPVSTKIGNVDSQNDDTTEWRIKDSRGIDSKGYWSTNYYSGFDDTNNSWHSVSATETDHFTSPIVLPTSIIDSNNNHIVVSSVTTPDYAIYTNNPQKADVFGEISDEFSQLDVINVYSLPIKNQTKVSGAVANIIVIKNGQYKEIEVPLIQFNLRNQLFYSPFTTEDYTLSGITYWLTPDEKDDLSIHSMNLSYENYRFSRVFDKDPNDKFKSAQNLQKVIKNWYQNRFPELFNRYEDWSVPGNQMEFLQTAINLTKKGQYTKTPLEKDLEYDVLQLLEANLVASVCNTAMTPNAFLGLGLVLPTSGYLNNNDDKLTVGELHAYLTGSNFEIYDPTPSNDTQTEPEQKPNTLLLSASGALLTAEILRRRRSSLRNLVNIPHYRINSLLSLRPINDSKVLETYQRANYSLYAPENHDFSEVAKELEIPTTETMLAFFESLYNNPNYIGPRLPIIKRGIRTLSYRQQRQQRNNSLVR